MRQSAAFTAAELIKPERRVTCVVSVIGALTTWRVFPVMGESLRYGADLPRSLSEALDVQIVSSGDDGLLARLRISSRCGHRSQAAENDTITRRTCPNVSDSKSASYGRYAPVPPESYRRSCMGVGMATRMRTRSGSTRRAINRKSPRSMRLMAISGRADSARSSARILSRRSRIKQTTDGDREARHAAR